MTFGTDERITKKAKTMRLEKPIKPGFRRPFTLTPDEALDAGADGAFATAEILSGDSTVTIDPASTATEVRGWLNGNGATGEKSVRFSADGRLGDGEQVITLDVEYTVSTPDATTLGFSVGVDEPIPAPDAVGSRPRVPRW